MSLSDLEPTFGLVTRNLRQRIDELRRELHIAKTTLGLLERARDEEIMTRMGYRPGVTNWKPDKTIGEWARSHSIDVMEFSARITNCLRKAGITTIGELAE